MEEAVLLLPGNQFCNCGGGQGIEGFQLLVFNAINMITQRKNAGAVRRDDTGFSLQLSDVFKNLLLCFQIQSGGYFIQKENRCVRQNCPGNGKPLILTDRQGTAPLF